jgi:cytochrome c oxidase assembly protein subunit 15
MNAWFVRLARIGAVLALAVVMLGAYVRLTDAGLGCPDWPGCYGRLVVPHPATTAEELGSEYTRPLEAGKAWREMIHRYLASTLGLICVGLAVIAWLNRRDPSQPWRVPVALVALVIFQGLLGMWTVTLLLKPIVVVAHLLGGFATLALLASLGRWRTGRFPQSTGGRRLLGITAAAALVLQMSRGGWTSANHAALACPDFPTCQTQWWPAITDFEEGFVLWGGRSVSGSPEQY